MSAGNVKLEICCCDFETRHYSKSILQDWCLLFPFFFFFTIVIFLRINPLNFLRFRNHIENKIFVVFFLIIFPESLNWKKNRKSIQIDQIHWTWSNRTNQLCMIYSQRISWDTDHIVHGLVLKMLSFFSLKHWRFWERKNIPLTIYYGIWKSITCHKFGVKTVFNQT